MGACSSRSEKTLIHAESIQNRNQMGGLGENLVYQTMEEDPMDKYNVVKRLGVGSIGEVMRVKKKDGGPEVYALKRLRVGRVVKQYVDEVKNEINAVRSMDHPNIVHFFEVYYYGSNISIVMDNCSGGDLNERQPYSEADAAHVVQQLLRAVAYMHEKGYIHRDIKPQNIMFDSRESKNIKLIDFGLAGHMRPGQATQFHKQIGTIDYMAPEVFGGHYTYKVDLWSTGVVAYELISGDRPFAGSLPTILSQIAGAQPKFDQKLWKKKSAAKSFVTSLLQKNPDKRPTGPQALQNVWLVNAAANASDESPIDEDEKKVLLKRFLSFCKTPFIKKVALIMVARKEFMEEVVEVRNMFEHLDKDQTGYIDFQEFQDAFSSTLSQDEMQDLFNGMDTFSDGRINYTEFLAAMLSAHSNISEERVAEAFHHLDVSHTSGIKKEDLHDILGKNFTEEWATQIVDEVNTLHSGEITYDEFVQAFRSKHDCVCETVLGEAYTCTTDVAKPTSCCESSNHETPTVEETPVPLEQAVTTDKESTSKQSESCGCKVENREKSAEMDI